jgi:putative MFS transporter
MATSISGQGANAANRLDRLPITSAHRLVVVALAFAYFFDLGDISTFAYTAPVLIKIWHLSVNTVAFITSATFGGMFVGALIGGWVGDRLGRKRGLLLTISCYALFSLLNAAAWDSVSLGTFRFLTGVGLASMTVVANTYISEFFPAVSRGRFQGWAMTIGLIGVPATSWIARFVIPLVPWGWRLVFVWGALGVIALLFVRRMHESPRWYEIHGRTAEAEEVLQRLESIATAEKGPLAAPQAPQPLPVVRRIPYRELFHGKYLGRTLLLMVVWSFQALGYYGLQSWTPILLAKHGFSVADVLTFSSAIAIGTPIGALLTTFITDRIDRKWALTINAIIMVVCSLLFGMASLPIFIVTFGFLAAVFNSSNGPLIYAYTPELYPTEARASGVGLTYGVGRMANVIGPLLVGFLLASYGYGSVFVYIAVSWLIVAICVGAFGPLTSRRSLESISESEVEFVSEAPI